MKKLEVPSTPTTQSSDPPGLISSPGVSTVSTAPSITASANNNGNPNDNNGDSLTTSVTTVRASNIFTGTMRGGSIDGGNHSDMSTSSALTPLDIHRNLTLASATGSTTPSVSAPASDAGSIGRASDATYDTPKSSNSSVKSKISSSPFFGSNVTSTAASAATDMVRNTTQQAQNATQKVTQQATNATIQATHQVAQATKQATKATQQVTNQVVDWTVKNTETAYGDRGLRPMHVRVSVRVHHVGFLHPGLDSGSAGGSAGNRGNMFEGVGKGIEALGNFTGTYRGGRVTSMSRWKKKNATTAATNPGLLRFGSKCSSWKNPRQTKLSPFSTGSGNSGGLGGGGNPNDINATNPNTNNAPKNQRTNFDSFHQEERVNPMDVADISEIISGESFRLSRDGIIQQHYALTSHFQRNNIEDGGMNRSGLLMEQSSHSFRGSGVRGGRRSTVEELLPDDAFTVIPHPSDNPLNFSSMKQSIKTSLLSPRITKTSENLADAARYYRECAERPKGYRRLVVSSAMNTTTNYHPGDGDILGARKVAGGIRSSASSVGGRSLSGFMSKDRSEGGTLSRPGNRYRALADFSRNQKLSRKRGTWDFDVDSSSLDYGSFHANSKDALSPASKQKNREGRSNRYFDEEDNDENLFDNVEYQYIGPARTGPEFFKLLRYHGGATFGRYLPELACSVPNHSICFELLKSKRTAASTQPVVAEAPHIIWGDARDKMLSRIAREGCPFIDAREFEYVSNANLRETEMSESLMICGATIWVENAPIEERTGKIQGSPVKQKHATKNMIKAEYYGGQFAEGVKDGFRGMATGTKQVIKSVDKVGKKLVPNQLHNHHSKGSKEDASSVTSEATQDSITRKKKVIRAVFKPKKVMNVFKRKKRSENDNGSVTSSVDHHDNMSADGDMAGERVTDALIREDTTDSIHGHFSDEQVTSDGSSVDIAAESVPRQTSDQSVKSETKTVSDNVSAKTGYSVVKPVPYIMISDDIIDIQIVSFPDSDVIAKFPISVASVMVQRSMEDRMNDPMKPSELTTTLIQEPNAPELRWGVELKITVRAVEVKPQLPRLLPVPDLKVGQKVTPIENELTKFKTGLMGMGKTEEEIHAEVEKKRDQVLNREAELDKAIVAFGMGKGENQGAGLNEIRHRQMFYDELEHKRVIRKIQRREVLCRVEKDIMRDANNDPSASISKKNDNDIQMLLDVHFPGVEEGYSSLMKSKLLASKRHSLDTIEEGIHGNSERSSLAGLYADGTNASNDHDHNIIASVSLAMAQSLDTCLGDIIAKPTVPMVQESVNKIRRSVSVGDKPPITRKWTRQWCSEVAKNVSFCASTFSDSDEDPRRSAARLQNIVARSASTFDVNLIADDVAESANDSSANDSSANGSETESFKTANIGSVTSKSDSTKIADWCTEIASKLEECAEELDDVDMNDEEIDEAMARLDSPVSERRTSIEQMDSTLNLKTGKKAAATESDGNSSANKIYRRSSSSSIFSMFDGLKDDYESDLDSNDVKKTKISSQETKDPEEKGLSTRAQRLFNSSTVSNIKESMRGHKWEKNSAEDIESLLRSMKEHHYQTHRSHTNKLSKSLVVSKAAVSFLKNETRSSSDTIKAGSALGKNPILLTGKSGDETRKGRSWFVIVAYALMMLLVFFLGVLAASKFDFRM